MKRPFATFLLAVLAPCLGAATLVLWWAAAESAALDTTSHVRAARLVLGALERELDEASDLLAQEAAQLTVERGDPAATRALAGDTVTRLRSAPGGVEIEVVLPDGQGGLRGGSAPFTGDAVSRAARLARVRAAPFLSGRRWPGWQGEGLPDSIPWEFLLRLASEGVAEAGDRGAFAATDPDLGLATYAGALTGRVPILPRGFVAVVGLLFLVAVVAARLRLVPRARDGGAPPAARHLVPLAVVPAIAFAVLALEADQRHRQIVQGGAAADLTRALAVAATEGMTSDVDRVAEVTGYATTLVEAGRPVASTAADGGAAVAGVPPPPPSFTSAGRVETPAGPATYVALAVRPSGFLVATAPVPEARLRAFRWKVLLLGLAVAAWLVGAAFVAVMRVS